MVISSSSSCLLSSLSSLWRRPLLVTLDASVLSLSRDPNLRARATLAAVAAGASNIGTGFGSDTTTGIEGVVVVVVLTLIRAALRAGNNGADGIDNGIGLLGILTDVDDDGKAVVDGMVEVTGVMLVRDGMGFDAAAGGDTLDGINDDDNEKAGIGFGAVT
jgi:hypothetical protein